MINFLNVLSFRFLTGPYDWYIDCMNHNDATLF